MVPCAHLSLPPKRHLDWFSRFAQLTIKCPITLQLAATFPPQIALSPWGIGSPSNAWHLGPTRVIIPNSISIGSAVSVWVPNAMLYNALSMGKNFPPIAPFPWDFVTLLEEDRTTAIGNMHNKLVKIAHNMVRKIYARTDRHTERQTDKHTDGFVTILRHRSHHWRSKIVSNKQVGYIHLKL